MTKGPCLLDSKKLTEISSDFIEPYLKDFLSLQIDGVGMGITSPSDARNHLAGVEYFVSVYCGIHSRLATSNMYSKFISLSDADLVDICRKVVETT